MMPRRRRSLPVVRGDAKSYFKTPVLNWPRYIITEVSAITTLVWTMSTLCYYFAYDLPPEFSVQLTPSIPTNITTTEAPSISLAFDAILHAGNRRATERCYHHGEAVVTYGGFTLASGRTTDFCVRWKGARAVPFGLSWDWDDGAGRLPEHLRGRIAAAERFGAVELEVQVRFLQGEDGRSGAGVGRPTWMWCKVRMGGEAHGVVTPCTVFASQNWFSHLT